MLRAPEWVKFGDKISEACTLVLGAFDGLHAGHLALLNAAKNKGLPVAITTISGGKGKQLFTRAEREVIFADTGIDFVYEIPFTGGLKNTSAEDFLKELLGSVAAKEIVCGEDFRFGKNALGTPELLESFHLPVTVVKTVRRNGEKVATSACKQFVSENNFQTLQELLINGYFIGGEVEHGREVGRTYGFPTLNLTIPEDKLLPSDGVYGGFAVTPKGRFQTIINIGSRPTFGVTERKLEAHLLDFEGDLYGATVQVYPTVFLRPISRFVGPEALKEQLQRDKKSIKEMTND